MMCMKCAELCSSVVVKRCGTVTCGIRWRRSDGVQFRRRMVPGLQPRADFILVSTSTLA